MFKRRIKLPVTIKEFEDLTDLLVRKFDLKDRHHAAAVLSVTIRHIPNDTIYTTLDYLGHSIEKNIANYVAYHKGETLKHEGQVMQLVSTLEADPLNNQALDELTRAASDGSAFAKLALDKFNSAHKNKKELEETIIAG